MEPPIVRLHASTGRSVTAVVETVLACKWSKRILRAVASGRQDYRDLLQSLDGVPNKVLSQRLERLQRFGILSRTDRDGTLPRVQFGLTAFGKAFMTVLDSIDRLDRSVSAGDFPELAGTVRGDTRG